MPDDEKVARRPAPAPPVKVSDDRKNYGRAILSEIRVMLDYLAANPATTIQDLKFDDPENPKEKLGLGLADVLARLDAIDEGLEDQVPRLSHMDLALLQLVRDTLSRLASPASGLSIAYTALITGTPWTRRTERPRTKLAEKAYPDFILTARLHSILQMLLLLLSIGLTGAAVWESTKVALGKSLLQNLAKLRVEQIALISEKAKLESTLDKASSDPITPDNIVPGHRLPLQFFSICDRQYVWHDAALSAGMTLPKDSSKQEIALRSSPAERDTCDRDRLLAINFGIAQGDLRQYSEYWPKLAGNSYEMIAAAIRSVECIFGCPSSVKSQVPPGSGNDIELRVAPLLLVWGNYNLPIVFAFLGACIYVILDYFGKLRESRLLPRDSHLSLIRLVLGLVTGACIGLFFSSYGPTSPAASTDLISSLSLSASGIAFLAGFGVEGVFTMLEGLVSRVFASQQK